ncbi:endolytic transglycosylase MltG [Legionella nagasakiensis]|uniref:endolytic transglycosylase MltG n=1 Tax=Legionella nagasakiensis TaxID=535290 RepID=UPI001056761C|nr:endolytic transglycosylase MltG [Legionella nagasakiensis]
MKRRWLKYFLVYCLALFAIGLAMMLGFDLYRLMYRPMLSEQHEPITMNLDKSTSASSFVHSLKARHLIESERLFLLLIRMQGLTKQLKAGIYQIQTGESAQQFLFRVVAGDVLQESFRIIEGTTQNQVAMNLKQAAYLTYSDKDWQAITDTFTSAEGLLLADTYYYDAGSGSRQVLAQAYANLQQQLEQSWQQRSPDLPYKSPYELLTVASILEKETSIPSEKRLIAGVIVNRLRKNMPLQVDPTVIYALGSRYKGKLTRKALQIDSPYNTYRYRGLPPTPIAMVGKDAIDAAAHPKVTNYLYFVAKGDGTHQFSVTYEQQKQAIKHYLRKN